jgi:hypothetical protein
MPDIGVKGKVKNMVNDKCQNTTNVTCVGPTNTIN